MFPSPGLPRPRVVPGEGRQVPRQGTARLPGRGVARVLERDGGDTGRVWGRQQGKDAHRRAPFTNAG